MRTLSQQYLNFVTNMSNMHLKRCIQSLEPIQSPNPAKKGPLPKLKIRRSENGLISELSEDPQRKSRENDVIPISDVIDLCDDDGVEIVSIKPAPPKKNSSGGFGNSSLAEDTRKSFREHSRRFDDYRTGNTLKSKIFKVSIDLFLSWPRMTFDFNFFSETKSLPAERYSIE